MSLVLASASPRRRELLTQAGYIFTVHPAHIPEDLLPNEVPIAYVVRLARQKAETVFAELTRSRIKSEQSNPPQVASASLPRASAPLQVLGADTTVVIDSDAVFPAISAVPASEQRASAAPQVPSAAPQVPSAAPQVPSAAPQCSPSPSMPPTPPACCVFSPAAPIASSPASLSSPHSTPRSPPKSPASVFSPCLKKRSLPTSPPASPWTRPAPTPSRAAPPAGFPASTGDYFNVVGLPLALVSTMLESVGMNPNRLSS